MAGLVSGWVGCEGDADGNYAQGVSSAIVRLRHSDVIDVRVVDEPTATLSVTTGNHVFSDFRFGARS